MSSAPFAQEEESGEIRLPSLVKEFASELEPHPVSQLFSHDAICCRSAKAWFTSVAGAFAFQNPGPPGWIRERWDWGPTQWPLSWCEAVRADKLDCGALAALARHAFRAYGMKNYAAQLIQRFDNDAVANWQTTWEQENADAGWIRGNLAYHEAVLVERPDGFQIWDPTDNTWMDHQSRGYGEIMAIRFKMDPKNQLFAGKWIFRDGAGWLF